MAKRKQTEPDAEQPDEQLSARVHQAYDAGKSMRAIALEVGRSPTYVRHVLGAAVDAPTKPRNATRKPVRLRVTDDVSARYDVRPKLENAVAALGNNAVADLLGVSASQPGRWLRGEERLSPASEQAVLDLDFVLSALVRAMPAALVSTWLVSPNAHLGNARPLDVLRVEGYRRVVDAVQAYVEGAYA